MERKYKKYTFTRKFRAFIAGLTPVAVFRITLITSVIIALAATIIYRTATKSLHVNINKVDTASVDLNGLMILVGLSPMAIRTSATALQTILQNRHMCS